MPEYMRFACAANSSSDAASQRSRSTFATSRSPDSAGPASTTITGPVFSGNCAASHSAMKPPMLCPTMIGRASRRERM